MTTLKVPVPDELLELLGSREAARQHLRRSAVLDLVRRRAISQGRGAELLGMSRWEFHELLAHEDVPMADLTDVELQEGRRNLTTALEP